jgi:hypothetical protein
VVEKLFFKVRLAHHVSGLEAEELEDVRIAHGKHWR